MPRILLIEDDASFRVVMRKAFERRGYELIEADNAATGVALARAHMPDLILSDVHMDNGDGYSALVALRQSKSTEGIPFILMTGQASLAGMRRGMEQGADDYLQKPFTFDSLFAAVQARLKKHQAIQRQAQNLLMREETATSLPAAAEEPERKLYFGMINGHLHFSCHPVIVVCSGGVTIGFPSLDEAEAYLRQEQPASALAYRHDGRDWKVQLMVTEQAAEAEPSGRTCLAQEN